MFKEEFTQLDVFRGLSADQLHILDSILDLCDFSKDEHIFEQGQVATSLFILAKGEVAVRYKPYDGPLLTVARILPGGVFGWSAALGRDMYTSGAVAVVESEAFRLSGAELHHFCSFNPEVGSILLDRLASVIAERLRNTHGEILTILTQGMDLDAECWKRMKNND